MYVVKVESAGATPESFHVIVIGPAGIDAPAAGEVNWTSASARGERTASATVRRVERSMLGRGWARSER